MVGERKVERDVVDVQESREIWLEKVKVERYDWGKTKQRDMVGERAVERYGWRKRINRGRYGQIRRKSRDCGQCRIYHLERVEMVRD